MSVQSATQIHSADAPERTSQSISSLPLAQPQTVTAIQAALREAGVNGRVRFSAQTGLIKGYETWVAIRDFKQTIDEPPSLGGTDLGPNPVEIVLAALGACQEIVYSTYAAVLGIPIDNLTIKVSGTLDPRGFFGVADVPAGFDSVEYEVDLASSSPEARIRELVQIVNQHCPVLDILQRPLPVQTRVALNGQSLV
ncbi:MAG TPA: OsmC family protein [Anaerolineae bacterium]